ncbi:MAG: hypothetical protein ABI692_01220 [Terracoccus sp.]
MSRYLDTTNQDATDGDRELDEQAELGAGEGDRLARPGDDPVVEPDHEVTGRDSPHPRPTGAA